MKLGFRILWIDDDWWGQETKIKLEQERCYTSIFGSWLFWRNNKIEFLNIRYK